MKGNPEIINKLNQALSEELSTIVQYIVHAEMQENWGYGALSQFIRKQAIGEMQHAEAIIERILYLDGTPEVTIALKPKIGANVKTQFANDLEGESRAIKVYNEAVSVCASAGDNGSRELFERLVTDEEEHEDWLEAQLHAISETGYENYLAQQLKSKGGGGD